MAPRKKTTPTVSLRKPVLKAAAVAPALKPQAAVMDTQGSGFGGSYSGWQSTMFSNSRRAIFGQAPGDLRQDLTPWNRMAMISQVSMGRAEQWPVQADSERYGALLRGRWHQGPKPRVDP